MQLKLQRETLTDDSTIGKLYINGTFHCYTLEDKVREVKIPHVTAIPQGKYEVILNFSNRFQQIMPLLLNVPNYEGVRIHWGNFAGYKVFLKKLLPTKKLIVNKGQEILIEVI
jgi:hypothetical protein